MLRARCSQRKQIAGCSSNWAGTCLGTRYFKRVPGQVPGHPCQLAAKWSPGLVGLVNFFLEINIYNFFKRLTSPASPGADSLPVHRDGRALFRDSFKNNESRPRCCSILHFCFPGSPARGASRIFGSLAARRVEHSSLLLSWQPGVASLRA